MIIFGGFAFSRINNNVRPLPITMSVPFIFSYLFRNTEWGVNVISTLQIWKLKFSMINSIKVTPVPLYQLVAKGMLDWTEIF